MRARDLPHVDIPVLLIREPCLLTPKDTARLLRISESTLHFWRYRRRLAGPSFVRVEGRIRYQLETLRDWVARQTVRTPLRIPRSIAERRRQIWEILREMERAAK
jgi:hypothetical protein